MFPFTIGDVITPNESGSRYEEDLSRNVWAGRKYEVFHVWTIDSGDSIDTWAVLWDQEACVHVTVLISEYLIGAKKYVWTREFKIWS